MARLLATQPLKAPRAIYDHRASYRLAEGGGGEGGLNYDVGLIFVHDILSTFGALPQLVFLNVFLGFLEIFLLTVLVPYMRSSTRIDIAPINQRPPG